METDKYKEKDRLKFDRDREGEKDKCISVNLYGQNEEKHFTRG